MNEMKLFESRTNFKQLSEYDQAVFMVEDGSIGIALKNKILKFTKNDKNVKLMLDTLSRKENECSKGEFITLNALDVANTNR